MPRQVSGDRTLPGTGWPVNGNNDSPRSRALAWIHPRLLAPRFGRALNP